MWKATVEGPLSAAERGEGLAGELGMYEDLCRVHEGEGWGEYGIVEDRCAALNPAGFGELLRRATATASRGPHRNPRYTASVYIATILGALRDRGVLAFD